MPALRRMAPPPGELALANDEPPPAVHQSRMLYSIDVFGGFT